MDNNSTDLTMKSRIIHLEPRSIQPHPHYEQYARILTLTDYALTSSSKLTPAAFRTYLRCHPVVVIESGEINEHHLCVAGLRILNLAKANLPPGVKMPAQLLQHVPEHETALMIHTDLLLSHLLYTVRRPDVLGTIFAILPENYREEILQPEARSRAGFTRMMNYSRNAVFKDTRNPKEEP